MSVITPIIKHAFFIVITITEENGSTTHSMHYPNCHHCHFNSGNNRQGLKNVRCQQTLKNGLYRN